MKERPILFSAPMVRAILDGTKTQTRRVVKGVRSDNCLSLKAPTKTRCGIVTHVIDAADRGLCPYGQPGDRLWVREAWQDVHPLQVADGRYSQVGRAGIPGPPPVAYRTIYRADGEYPSIYSLGGIEYPYRRLEPFEYNGIQASEEHYGWTPSIHMPRWASRITLELTGVRVERLNDCSDADALAEGVDRTNTSISGYARERFRRLWESTGGNWAANPWVWVIEFQRVVASGSGIESTAFAETARGNAGLIA